jgi:hypothetical protein
MHNSLAAIVHGVGTKTFKTQKVSQQGAQLHVIVNYQDFDIHREYSVDKVVENVTPD